MDVVEPEYGRLSPDLQRGIDAPILRLRRCGMWMISFHCIVAMYHFRCF